MPRVLHLDYEDAFFCDCSLCAKVGREQGALVLEFTAVSSGRCVRVHLDPGQAEEVLTDLLQGLADRGNSVAGQLARVLDGLVEGGPALRFTEPSEN